MTRITALPPRPVFDNDLPPQTKPAMARSPVAPPVRSPAPSPSPVASPAPTPTPLEPGAHAARVTEPIGLVLRQDPSQDSGRIGGIDYNEQLTVLETSSDGEWERVRLKGSNIEGWVKAGNTQQTN
jgi:Bacterial SH3 domain